MATRLAGAHGTAAVAAPARRLLLIWQNPRTRLFSAVGRLSAGPDSYVFEYLSGAHDPDFEPLPSFPDLDEVYTSSRMPSFFRNRVMSRARSSYSHYADWLGIDATADLPFEVLARTGGGRATDTFHVVEEPVVDEGMAVIRFFASGLRHVPNSEALLESIAPGDVLLLREQPDNRVKPLALVIDRRAGQQLGWVPDWLVGEVHNLRRQATDLKLMADQVNVEAPWHLKLLCRLEADCR